MPAPTDAALGQAVIADARIPVRVRQTLNAESGLNDGMAAPVFAVVLATVAGGAEAPLAAWYAHRLVHQPPHAPERRAVPSMRTRGR